jgi:hypothetical protein
MGPRARESDHHATTVFLRGYKSPWQWIATAVEGSVGTSIISPEIPTVGFRRTVNRTGRRTQRHRAWFCTSVLTDSGSDALPVAEGEAVDLGGFEEIVGLPGWQEVEERFRKG